MKKQFGFTLEEVQPSPQRGEGAFVGGAVQMRVRGLILPLKNFSLLTFHFSRKRAAFTLAEVLITLGIIGVVAAMTMPILIENYQKHETVNRLKETYSILYQAVRMSETENGLLETWEIPDVSSNSADDCYNKGKIFFEQYLKPYIKIAKDCTASECWAENHTRPNGATFNFSNLKTYNIVLANGTVIAFFPRGTSVEFYTDLNGKKGPNRYGRDWFDIVISNKSRNDVRGNFDKSGVYMYGQGKSRKNLTTGAYACSKTATEYAGVYCGALILHDGWKIAPDYPW